MNDKRTTEMCGGCGNYDPAQRCIGCLHEFTPAAKPVPEHISDERLAEMLAAAEKATPGPRERHVIDASTYRYVEDAEKAVARDQADADFNALCDPQTITALLTELQHRREAEAGAPEGWVLVPREPTIDMASAGWDAIMAHTGFHEVDDRAEKAYRAMLAASPSSPASGVRVKALEWVKHPEVAAWRCDSIVGRYQVFAVNPGHASWSMDGQPGVAVGGFVDDADDAKAAAQADYEARIRSALGEHP